MTCSSVCWLVRRDKQLVDQVEKTQTQRDGVLERQDLGGRRQGGASGREVCGRVGALSQVLGGPQDETLKNNCQSPLASGLLPTASRQFLHKAREKPDLSSREEKKVLQRIPRGSTCWLKAGRSFQTFLKVSRWPFSSFLPTPSPTHTLPTSCLWDIQASVSLILPRVFKKVVAGLERGAFPSPLFWWYPRPVGLHAGTLHS